jgi:spore maturation protein CgeB
MRPLRIVIFGLSITSSWGNGHATPYRSLMRALSVRGPDVLFLERDAPGYAAHRDLPHPPFGRTRLYSSLREAKELYRREVREADVVIVGSCVPEGTDLGRWVTQSARGLSIFYDMDTPVTMAKLERGDEEYISRELVPRFDMYLSFTGGPMLDYIERKYGTPMARPLYCSVDPTLYHPEPAELRWDLGYMGTYSADRQPTLTKLLIQPARRRKTAHVAVVGPGYPEAIEWPANVERIEHLPPAEHPRFYSSQRFTLNITRSDMVRAGYSPGVRLFEAAACGAAIISDDWDGLSSFFKPEAEILVARNSHDTLRYLRDVPEKERIAIGNNARARVMSAHTAAHRAAELETYLLEAFGEPDPSLDFRAVRVKTHEEPHLRSGGELVLGQRPRDTVTRAMPRPGVTRDEHRSFERS